MNYQDSLGNWEEIILEPSGDTLPIGAITEFGGANAPTNWLFCDGSAISRTDYAELFSAIGTTYGTGDGSTTFNLPDFRGRVPVGLKSSDSSFDTLGEAGGEKTHTLTVNEMPSHKHYISSGAAGETAFQAYSGIASGYTYEASNQNPLNLTFAGGDQPHNNLQPYIVTNYIIKAKQSIGVVGIVTNDITDVNNDAVPNCKTVKDYAKENYLLVSTTTATSLSSSSTTVVLNSAVDSEGSKFTLSNNKIVIGAGVSKVRISGSLFVEEAGSAGYVWTRLTKTSGNAVTNESGCIMPGSSNSSYLSTPVPPTIVDVSEGDTIHMVVESGINGKSRVGKSSTWLLIEEIK